MIALEKDGEYLDLGSDTQFNIEIYNPLFDFTKVPGTLVLPFNIKLNRHNARLLGHPQVRGTKAGQVRTISGFKLYLLGTLWRIGSLHLLRGSSDQVRTEFVSDAADFEEDIAGLRLRDLPLGTEPFNLAVQPLWPAANYALFPVRNPGFFGTDALDYRGYQNYYSGAFPINSASNKLEYGYSPFPYVAFILKKIFGHLGYQLSGPWLDESETARLVIYNTADLNTGPGTYNQLQSEITWTNHVPDITVGEFLLALRNLLALGIAIDANRKTCRIVSLIEVVSNQSYLDRTSKTMQGLEWDTNDKSGFLLSMEPDGSDKLHEFRDATWQTYQAGKGQQQVSTSASSLFMYQGQDTATPARNWTVPEADQATESFNEFSSSGSPATLRLLMYHELQPDSLGGTYPLGSSGEFNQLGASLGTYTLEWAGSAGLYERRQRPWLDFLDASSTEKRQQQLTIADLSTLNPERKEMVDQLKFLWQSITITATSSGLKPAKVVYKRISL